MQRSIQTTAKCLFVVCFVLSTCVFASVRDVNTLTSSIDPLCRVNLTATAHLWTSVLPVIKSATQLRRSEWLPYLTAVYGNLEDPVDFPIDLRCFTFFYPHLIPTWVASILNQHMRTANKSHHDHLSNGDVLMAGTRRFAWQVYLLGSHSEPSAILYIPMTAAHKRVEIWHDFDDCRHAGIDAVRDGAQIGFWGHFAPGSGIFATMGRTLITGANGYREACKRFVAHPEVRCAGCCRPVHQFVYKALSRLGYDSMQSCCGYRDANRGIRNFEITLFSGRCGSNPHSLGGCPAHINQRLRPGQTESTPWLSRGRGTPLPCNCMDNSSDIVNCAP